jgi:hypothetical protein
MIRRVSMRQFIAAAGLALALATPAFAQVSPDYPITDPLSSNPRIRGEQEWWRLVAKVDAERQQQEQQTAPAPQHAAINNGAAATDAAVGSAAMGTSVPAAPAVSAGCPGTDAAGQPWRPGEYCLPGGR